MRRVTTALITGIIAAGTVLVAPPADAATPGCVTRAEWRKVHNGDRPGRVTRVFGTAGIWASGGGGGYDRAYVKCGTRGAMAAIGFAWRPSDKRDHLYGKTWNRDAASPHRVSWYEYVIVGERTAGASVWSPPYDSGRIYAPRPTRRWVERLFDERGRRAEGGGYYYLVARQGEWPGRARTWFVLADYRNGRLVRIRALR